MRPTHPSQADVAALLRRLAEAGVELIVVGGTAAQLHGSSLSTLDLDIVHRRTPENVDRLLRVLEALDAFHRYDLAKRRLPPTREQLSGSGQLNLSTRLGPLDPLCELEPGQGYDELIEHTVRVDADGWQVRVLDLPTLIAVKAKVGRAKDKLAIAELVALSTRAK